MSPSTVRPFRTHETSIDPIRLASGTPGGRSRRLRGARDRIGPCRVRKRVR
ncbi:MAG: hypothetical protein QOI09_1225, partial [Chloroflexota bacterium]|nr:hypothetical protein [Chloroflexota bacterium]